MALILILIINIEIYLLRYDHCHCGKYLCSGAWLSLLEGAMGCDNCYTMNMNLKIGEKSSGRLLLLGVTLGTKTRIDSKIISMK